MKHIPCLAGDPQRLHQLMRREITIMKRVSYDANVVQFYGACSGDDGAWVCMELMEARICLLSVDEFRSLSESASNGVAPEVRSRQPWCRLTKVRARQPSMRLSGSGRGIGSWSGSGSVSRAGLRNDEDEVECYTLRLG